MYWLCINDKNLVEIAHCGRVGLSFDDEGSLTLQFWQWHKEAAKAFLDKVILIKSYGVLLLINIVLDGHLLTSLTAY